MVSKTLKRPDLKVTIFQDMVTVSNRMLKFFELVQRAARTHATVLVRGETGTGKELVGRALHRLSARHKGPFQTLNCATLTPELLASELFGHVRGAFTGAIKDRLGLFLQANGGTIFLDEIAEVPLGLQGRLLRVLQERTFVPLGGSDPVKVDVRVISATNKPLREEVAQGRFREDLMYRIRVVPLFLPRLAEREGDVEALIWHFIEEFNQLGYREIDEIDAKAMDCMLAYSWPGNVRELRNVVEYAFSLGEGPVFQLEDLLPDMRGELPFKSPPIASTGYDLEREMILQALRETKGRKGLAAERLEMSRSTLWRKMREHRLGP